MTTTRTRPIPNHGTASRYRGDPRNGRWDPCKCNDCRADYNRKRKAVLLRKARGQESRRDVNEVATHIERLLNTGWTCNTIADAAGVDRRGMYNIRFRRQKSVNHATANRILGIRTPGAAYWVDATSSRRRVQALAAIGWSQDYIGRKAGVTHTTITHVAGNRSKLVAATTRDAIAAVYRDLCETPGPSGWVRARAAKFGWAGPIAWDDDTIGDPNAIPEWTGYCGTDRGWWTHRQQNIPVCDACDQAHTQWKRDHQHLPRTELMASLNASRASASQRGEAIAHDGRELLAQGHTPEQAAARLGISTDYLHQELRRHPAPGESEAA
ncbi:hypothetical protein [Streptomyces griseus]|uniref:hypothetical protein n=1 Tax=Streptomyces griseus TaxID=1911 RepID=UPI0037932391